jgi:ubiquinone/menaquinone biosynthesis C-methylase UbiE
MAAIKNVILNIGDILFFLVKGSMIKNNKQYLKGFYQGLFKTNSPFDYMSSTSSLKKLLGKTDMYLIDLLQKGYFDNPLNVLDVGCGQGRNMCLLNDLGHKVTGLDVSIQQIEALNKAFLTDKTIKHPMVRVGELGDLPIEDSSFDFIICNAVLHFAKSIAHFQSMFDDLVRVVNKNGVIFIRLVTSHTLGISENDANKVVAIPDGTERFVVDYAWLKSKIEHTNSVGYAEQIKTVNIDGKRSMTTVILRAK